MTAGDKQDVRERVWRTMQEAKVARFPGARGRIPNFTGAEAAAELLAAQPEWGRARALKCNPDQAQHPVRSRALRDGKRVYMAVPRLAEELPFILLDPERIDASYHAASSIKGAATHGASVRLEELPHIDLIVCGTVAVDRRGARVGKGGGYSDLEFALCVEAGSVGDATAIATTVHALQVLDEELPETGHDFRVGVIVTPVEVIRPRRARRPPGIVWDDLDDDKIAEIPVLARMRSSR